MFRSMDDRWRGSGERRWVILTGDGRYATLGRASDPSEQDIQRAEDGLRRQGLVGWLAIMQGNPFIGPLPTLMLVRPLAGATEAFDEAASNCLRNITDGRST